MALVENAQIKPEATVVDKAAAKKAAAKRFAENKKKRAEAAVKAAEALKAELVKLGMFDKLSEGSKKFIEGIVNPVHTGFSGTSVLVTVFGANPKVGDTVTLQEVFQKTLKGKSSFDAVIKRWEEKGIEVEYKEEKDVLKSTYTIKKLPA